MKKWIMAIVCLMTMVAFTSCGTKYVVTANYDVCYPDGTRNFNGLIVIRSSTEPNVACYSYGGTNYVSVLKTDVEINGYAGSYGMGNINVKIVEKAEHFSSSTAPMRLNSYNIEKAKKKKQKQNYAYEKAKKDDAYLSLRSMRHR